MLRVGARQAVEVDAFSRVLDRLYSEQVAPIEVRPYVSHLPLYSLRAAAGGLGDEMPSEPEDWVRAPRGCGWRLICSWRTWWGNPWSRAFRMAA